MLMARHTVFMIIFLLHQKMPGVWFQAGVSWCCLCLGTHLQGVHTDHAI